MSKNIILLSDGTGNAAAKVWRTNVWRIFESLDLSTPHQVAIYDDGVGTSSFKPLAILGGGFGWGLKRNILDLYKFLCRNYQTPDDQIFAFGFSRGAFTIRVALGLAINQGLVKYETEAELNRKAAAAYRCYRRERYHSVLRHESIFRGLRAKLQPSSYDKGQTRPIARVRFVGLWDTVAAYGLPMEEMTRGVSQWIWPLELPDRKLSTKVSRACHALALDDERTTFHPVLWSERTEQPAPPDAEGNRHTKDERISQVWFPGAHSNVGGGYPDDALAHIPLYWIMNEAQQCRLEFKRPPNTDPDVILRARSARDKDGRQYDPRRGLGGYYRYGPRKLAALCHQSFSNAADDEVTIDKPKIHESVFLRTQVGAHVYAPIGIPEDYEVVTDKGVIIPSATNPYETSQHALARSQLQEKVWNLVWLRRVVYFATVVASAHLLLYPLQAVERSAEYKTSLRPVADAIRFVGAFLPKMTDHWIAVYASNPGRFILSLGAVGLLMMLGSMIGSRITDGMLHIWKHPLNATGPVLLPSDWIYRLRTHPWYQLAHRILKRHLAPAFFAIVFVWLAVTLTSHLAFNFIDSAGLVCPDEPTVAGKKTEGLARKEKKTMRFNVRDACFATGVLLEEHGRYRLTVSPALPWKDGSIPTSTRGFYISDLTPGRQALMVLGWPLKRSLFRPWFRVIARIGSTGADEEFLDPDRDDPRAYILQEVIRARRDGQLFFYVNDAVIPIPGLYDFFYRNNSGEADITIERL